MVTQRLCCKQSNYFYVWKYHSFDALPASEIFFLYLLSFGGVPFLLTFSGSLDSGSLKHCPLPPFTMVPGGYSASPLLHLSLNCSIMPWYSCIMLISTQVPVLPRFSEIPELNHTQCHQFHLYCLSR